MSSSRKSATARAPRERGGSCAEHSSGRSGDFSVTGRLLSRFAVHTVRTLKLAPEAFQSFLRFAPLRNNARETSIFRRTTNDHDYIQRVRPQVISCAKRLSYQSFGSISNNSTPYATRRRDPESCGTTFARTHQQENESGGNHSSPTRLNSLELRVSFHSPGGGIGSRNMNPPASTPARPTVGRSGCHRGCHADYFLVPAVTARRLRPRRRRF